MRQSGYMPMNLAHGGCCKWFFSFLLVLPLLLVVLQPSIAIFAAGWNLQDGLDVQASTEPDTKVQVWDVQLTKEPRESRNAIDNYPEYQVATVGAESAQINGGEVAGLQTEKPLQLQQKRNTLSNKGLWAFVMLTVFLSLGAYYEGFVRAPWQEAPSQARARLKARIENLRQSLPLANILAATVNTAEAFRRSDLVKESLVATLKAQKDMDFVPLRFYPMAMEHPKGLLLQERMLKAIHRGVKELRALQEASHRQVKRLRAAVVPMTLVSPSLAHHQRLVQDLLGNDYWEGIYTSVKSFEKDHKYLCHTAKSVYGRSKEEPPIHSEGQHESLLSAVLNLQYMHFAEKARATAEEAAVVLQAALPATVSNVMLKEIDITVGVVEVYTGRLQSLLRLHKDAKEQDVQIMSDTVTEKLTEAKQCLSELSDMYLNAEDENELKGLKKIRRKALEVSTRVMKLVKEAEELAEKLLMKGPSLDFKKVHVDLGRSVVAYADGCHREIKHIVEHLKVMGHVGAAGEPGARPYICKQYLSRLIREAEQVASEAEVATNNSEGITKLLEASQTVEDVFHAGKGLSSEMEKARKARKKIDIIIAHAKMLHNLETDMATSASAAEAAVPKGLSGELRAQLDTMKKRLLLEQQWAGDELSLAEIAEYAADMRARVERIDFLLSEKSFIQYSKENGGKKT